ncbi:hypothetical protein thsps117_06320 [Pseudomonas sp. No.117]
MQTLATQVLPEGAFGIGLVATQAAGVGDEGHGNPFPWVLVLGLPSPQPSPGGRGGGTERAGCCGVSPELLGLAMVLARRFCGLQSWLAEEELAKDCMGSDVGITLTPALSRRERGQ